MLATISKGGTFGDQKVKKIDFSKSSPKLPQCVETSYKDVKTRFGSVFIMAPALIVIVTVEFQEIRVLTYSLKFNRYDYDYGIGQGIQRIPTQFRNRNRNG